MGEFNSFSEPGFVTETYEDNSIFLLNGNVGLTLNDNSTSRVLMIAANTEVGVILNATDKNETIYDLTTNSSPTVILQPGGVSGVTSIFGYGYDPSAAVDITAKDLTSITHNPAGTSLTTVTGGKVNIIGGNYGITAQFGSGPESTLLIGNLNAHEALTLV
ncbi:hypothetical protein [Rhodopila sp.]|uniref:hypothetical protein n=1 Tax=Rhodopila sp. TaxID=2480087 RepID=UPI003D0D0FC9